MPIKLTEQIYSDRREAISELLVEAQAEYSNSALEVATLPGNADAEHLQTGCRERIRDLEEQVKALDAAWIAQKKLNEADKRQETAKAYQALREKVSAEMDCREKALKDAIESAKALAASVDAYETSNKETLRNLRDYSREHRGTYDVRSFERTLGGGQSVGIRIGKLLEQAGLAPSTIVAPSGAIPSETDFLSRSREKVEGALDLWQPGVEG